MRSSTRTGLLVLEASLLLGLLGDALLRALPWGLNVLLWVGALAAAYGALVRRGRVRLGGEGRWLVPAALAVAFAFVWRDSLTLKTIDFFAVLALLALGQLRARAGRVRLAGVTEYALAALFAAASAVVGPLLLVAQDIGWKEIPRGGWSRHAFAALRGLVIAAPLVLVFGALFVAADAVYEGMVARTFNIKGEAVVSHAVLFCFLSWMSAGYLRGAFIGPERAAGASLPAHVALSFGGSEQGAAAGAADEGNAGSTAATGETKD
ncbi:MAG TPA: DUF4153 domain-containing protein, partial [Pyrinomonadaceae bacterium]|nr:DUF4153 domain-containing protein [Pyrinomonadaceae bacterium]